MATRGRSKALTTKRSFVLATQTGATRTTTREIVPASACARPEWLPYYPEAIVESA